MSTDHDWNNGKWHGDLVEIEQGYTWHISHEDMGDMYLVEWEGAEPHMDQTAFDAVWDLIDEDIYPTKAKAMSAIRAWHKLTAGTTP